MKAFRSVLALVGVCLAVVVLTMPFMVFGQAATQELWVMQAVLETREHLRLVPRLNGMELMGQNPLQIILLSVLPASAAGGRMAMVVLGLMAAGAVYLYAHLLWGRRAGTFAALFTASSIGFLQGFSLLNTAALPCVLFLWGYLIFSLAYLKEGSRNWYLPAYACILAAMLTGGLELLALFVGAVILLVLFDVSPRRFAQIRPAVGLGALIGAAFVFYLTYRIGAGSAYVASILWPGGHLGLIKALAYASHAALPWLPLLVPAWIFTARPQEWEDWRTLLPAKIVFILVVVLLWFSGHGIRGYALLTAPAAGLLIGYWAGNGLRATPGLEVVTRIALVCAALLIAALPIVDLGSHPRLVPDMDAAQAIMLSAVFAAVCAMLFLVKTRRHGAVITAGMLAVCLLAWQIPLSERLEGLPEDYVEDTAQYQPLLVMEDDLVMRGALGLAGARPIVVGRGFVPVGGDAYLAVATGGIKGLVKKLQGRMQAAVVSRIDRGATYALIRVAPREQERPGTAPAHDPLPPADAEGI
ncbi:MAG TPA: glycosyltransferase family 39 protein [Deltaproteobacteria bacterium]|nr:glycosyltransferase family 39 protein [Deltaproteobacteria bacterium]